MRDIKLDSRYKDVVTLYKSIDDDHGVLISNGDYTRHILNEDGTALKAVDFEGGPMVSIGEPMVGTFKKIKSIKTAYYVELE